MNTFTSDYISTGNSSTGITANVVKSIPRQVSFPVKLPVFTGKNIKTIQEIKTTLLKLTDLLVKNS
jgi:hypothetical protein